MWEVFPTWTDQEHSCTGHQGHLRQEWPQKRSTFKAVSTTVRPCSNVHWILLCTLMFRRVAGHLRELLRKKSSHRRNMKIAACHDSDSGVARNSGASNSTTDSSLLRRHCFPDRMSHFDLLLPKSANSKSNLPDLLNGMNWLSHTQSPSPWMQPIIKGVGSSEHCGGH
jgi:hypothetical protein